MIIKYYETINFSGFFRFKKFFKKLLTRSFFYDNIVLEKLYIELDITY